MPLHRREIRSPHQLDSTGSRWAEAFTRGREDWLDDVFDGTATLHVPATPHRLRTMGTGHWTVDLGLSTPQPANKRRRDNKKEVLDVGISRLSKTVNHSMEGIISQLSRYQGSFTKLPKGCSKSLHREMYKNVQEEMLRDRTALLDDADISLSKARKLIDGDGIKRKAASERNASQDDEDDESGGTPKKRIMWMPTKMSQLEKVTVNVISQHRAREMGPSSEFKAKVAQIKRERAIVPGGKLVDLVKLNTSSEALRASSPSPRATNAAKSLAQRMVGVQERRRALTVMEEERHHAQEENVKMKLKKAEQTLRIRKADAAQKVAILKQRKLCPMVAGASRLHVLGNLLRLERASRLWRLHCGFAATMIQRLVQRRILAPKRFVRFKRGYAKLKVHFNRYIIKWRLEQNVRSAKRILDFCLNLCGESMTLRAIKAYAFRMCIIQRTWRAYSRWMHSVSDSRVALLYQMEDKQLKDWKQKHAKYTRSLEVDPSGQSLGPLKDFDARNSPIMLNAGVRQQLIYGTFKEDQKNHLKNLAEDEIEFKEYMRKLRTRVAMDKARKTFGMEKDPLKCAQALNAPQRPEYPVALKPQQIKELAHRGRAQIIQEAEAAERAALEASLAENEASQ